MGVRAGMKEACLVISKEGHRVSFVAESREVAKELLQQRPDDLDKYDIETWAVWEKSQ